jgi:hypothetical protein
MIEVTADTLVDTFQFEQLAEALLQEADGIPCAHGCVSVR